MPRKKKSLFLSAPSSNFYNNKKKSHIAHQILSLGKHIKCTHFSDDMVFSLALVIFQFFSDENQEIYFSFSKKIYISLTLIIFHFFSMRTKIFIFCGLTKKVTNSLFIFIQRNVSFCSSLH